ncbi:MAG TPA: UbiD family decarboxylase [Rhodospirillaceae bacterium]|nr:MAG: hypothetical protein A2018_08190 [Alphaproteobacteria bacterium GWF2_58_20]HAU29949.1 UbiD family decarboxylase [Rhodospirillaceae bacterium]
MVYRSMRDFLAEMEAAGDLLRISEPVSSYLEMTEISQRLVAHDGPAVLFEKPVLANGQISSMPALANLFGARRRIARGMGLADEDGFGALGEKLARLSHPQPGDDFLSMAGSVLGMPPRKVQRIPAQEVVNKGRQVNLETLPVQTCWPGDAGPLVTWPLVVTKGPAGDINVGVYRMQVLGRNRTILRWLPHRGGAQHFAQWTAAGKKKMPVSVVIGADPATILAAATPLPEGISEYAYSGLLRGRGLELGKSLCSDLPIPAQAEIVLEGHVAVGDVAAEGPFGDHTGYYNEVESFPVFHVEALTHRRDAIYHTTHTGRPPDEPSVIALAFKDMLKPMVQRQFPEIVDLHLPQEACSYRMAVVSIKKTYPGQARRVMMGLWSYLRQFLYTKIIIVVDEDIDVRNWKDVMWAVATRMDPVRDILPVEGTPIDYLDFASPASGLGGKLGLDATNKLPPETGRVWGRKIERDEAVAARMDELFARLGLEGTAR